MELRMVRVETVVTTHDGKRITYALNYLYDRLLPGEEYERLVWAQQQQLVEMMLHNNHLFGSAIGPLRIVDHLADLSPPGAA
jgi:hypothetical protein